MHRCRYLRTATRDSFDLRFVGHLLLIRRVSFWRIPLNVRVCQTVLDRLYCLFSRCWRSGCLRLEEQFERREFHERKPHVPALIGLLDHPCRAFRLPCALHHDRGPRPLEFERFDDGRDFALAHAFLASQERSAIIVEQHNAPALLPGV